MSDGDSRVMLGGGEGGTGVARLEAEAAYPLIFHALLVSLVRLVRQ